MNFLPTFLTSIVLASPSFGITVSPPFQEISFNASSPQDAAIISLTNHDPMPHSFHLTTTDFDSLSEYGGVSFIGTKPNDFSEKYGLASWMSLQSDSLVLSPGQTGKITVTILNKQSLSPGGHYGAILGTLTDLDNSGNPLLLKPVISSLLLVKKIGGERYDLKLSSTSNNSSPFSPASEVRLRFQNAGNVHVTPRGTIHVTDVLGREVASGTINEDSAVVLPESFRIYPIPLRSEGLAILPGTYQVQINYRYDGREYFTTTYLRYFYFGWPVILMMVFLLGLVALILKFRYAFKASLQKLSREDFSRHFKH
jgi:hypothetical protein